MYKRNFYSIIKRYESLIQEYFSLDNLLISFDQNSNKTDETKNKTFKNETKESGKFRKPAYHLWSPAEEETLYNILSKNPKISNAELHRKHFSNRTEEAV